MKTMTKHEWWVSLTENSRNKYCKEFDKEPPYVQKAYEKYYLSEQFKFTPGQEVWVDGVLHTYLYAYPKENTDTHYVVKGGNKFIASKPVKYVEVNEISATKPLPEIKPGTPVLCWDDYNPEYKDIMLFCKYENSKAVVTSGVGEESISAVYDHCEIYKND